MTIRLEVHPDNPQARLIAQAVAVLDKGGLVAYPTDSGYALGWRLTAQSAQERVVRLRGLDSRHNFTLVCRHLSEVGAYARMHDAAFRLVRSLTPGPYTFILPAAADVPRHLKQIKKKSVGVRVPDHRVALALVEALGEPLSSSSLILPNVDMAGWEVDDLYEHAANAVDLFIDSGFCGNEPTTVIDLVDDTPKLVRKGKGEVPFAE
ncbi:L-threonylcarbamoyladenylate synthase [Tahibacter soli]|jgi:tRNA threonylcarbamoyl adenosine modification protein (Sua5/YciO/YrdC/YwlC family)|uniref:L-threonylcarbamoyladenylate synthase n=1 Tax=Tahibacter soli TaxID=2983605 RepID=A0A9X3YQF1_9GAMM|nr:L-threonylcarbamoyladenylate synthase [Tahibacter soli]MDC8015093.1 L-threonylcarbamoyladenylate synthase [Tahibacter soli]